jgi:hypothetical protein
MKEVQEYSYPSANASNTGGRQGSQSSDQKKDLRQLSPPKSSSEKRESSKYDLQCELESLRKKETELLSALQTANDALEELGLSSKLLHSELSTENERKNDQVERLKASGLRNFRVGGIEKGEAVVERTERRKTEEKLLSFRGEDKAKEYFQFVASSSSLSSLSSTLGYEDLRSVNSFQDSLALFNDLSYHSNLSWNIAMLNDNYCLEVTPTSSSSSTSNSVDQIELRLNQESFLQFRQQIEEKQPLTRELEILGLSYLPSYLLEWKKLKSTIQEIEAIRPFVKTVSKEELSELKGMIAIDEMLFVLNNLGFNFTKPEVPFPFFSPLPFVLLFLFPFFLPLVGVVNALEKTEIRRLISSSTRLCEKEFDSK